MTDGGEQSRKTQMQLRTQRALDRSKALAAYAARAAQSTAAGREQFDRMVERRAEQSNRLHEARSTAARRRAATAARKDGLSAGDRTKGPFLPGPHDESEPASFPAPNGYLRDMAAAQERERIAGQLLDIVTQRFFAIGMALAGTAGMTMAPQARKLIEDAARDLDDLIRAIRDAVIFTQQHLASSP